MPQQAAGRRIEPPVSVPSAPERQTGRRPRRPSRSRSRRRQCPARHGLCDVAVMRVVAEGAERQLGHVELAERDRARRRSGGPPPCSRARAEKYSARLGPARRGQAHRRGRDPCRRAARRAAARASVPAASVGIERRGRGPARRRRIHRDERAQPTVETGDAIQAGLRGLDRRDLARGDGGGQLRQREVSHVERRARARPRSWKAPR